MAYCTKAEVKLYLDIRETEVEKDALIEALIISSQAFIDELNTTMEDLTGYFLIDTL